MVGLLLAKGPDVDAQDVDGNTALMEVCLRWGGAVPFLLPCRHREGLKLLLTHGDDVHGG